MTRGQPLSHLPWRLAGVVLLALLVVAYQPDRHDPVQRLLIPVGMALGAWMMVQNAAAVALGAGVLAILHSEPGGSDPIRAIAYPLLAALCCAVAGTVFVRRFRQRIADTHEARWRHRGRSAPEHKR